MKALSAYLPLVLAAIILLSAPSCSDRSGRVSAALSAADSLMMTRPQAALDTLSGIDSTEVRKMRSRDRAFYTLLRTEARYKCWYPVDTDTAVFEAADYFRRKGPDGLYARALLMKGAVHKERHEPIDALEAYKTAEPIFDKHDNQEQIGLLHTRIGELYQNTFVDKESSVERYRKALHCFENAGASSRFAPANLTLARTLLSQSNLDEALGYITSGIHYAVISQDISSLANGKELMSWYYLYSGDYDRAVRTAKDALKTLNTNCKQLTTVTAFGYAGLHKADSAILIARTLPTNTTADSISVLMILCEASKDSGNWKNAFKYMDSLSTMEKSLIIRNKNYDLKTVEDYYTARNRELMLMNRNKSNILMSLAVISFLLLTGLSVIIHFLRINTRQKRELSEISSMFIELSEKLLASSKKHKQPEYFQETIHTLIKEFFQGDGISAKIRHITNTLYPGFIEELRKKYCSLTDSDLLIISLYVCGFSTKSITVICRKKDNALYTAKNRIAQKAGHTTGFSDFINDEIADFKKKLKNIPTP